MGEALSEESGSDPWLAGLPISLREAVLLYQKACTVYQSDVFP